MNEDPKYFHYEGVPSTEFAWEKIRYIGELLKAEKRKEKEEKENKKKKERTRTLNVPMHLCKDINELTSEHIVDTINFYETVFNNKHYIFDIYKTTDMKFFIRITDVTDNAYNILDFNDFKKKYAQPNLFDYFDI